MFEKPELTDECTDKLTYAPLPGEFAPYALGGIAAVVRMNAVYSRMAANENLGKLLDDASSLDRVVGEHFVSQDDSATASAG